MFKHILAPIDGSDNAQRALATAAELVKLTGAELTVVTLFRHHSPLEGSFSIGRDQTAENIDDILREHAREIAEAGKAQAVSLGIANPRAFVRNGPIARGIVAFAKEHDCDLIVVGSRGLGSVEGFLLGSVSHKVTGLAECPVLVV